MGNYPTYERWRDVEHFEMFFLVVLQIDEAKKSAAEAQRPSESETVYKNNLV